MIICRATHDKCAINKYRHTTTETMLGRATYEVPRMRTRTTGAN